MSDSDRDEHGCRENLLPVGRHSSSSVPRCPLHVGSLHHRETRRGGEGGGGGGGGGGG